MIATKEYMIERVKLFCKNIDTRMSKQDRNNLIRQFVFTEEKKLKYETRLAEKDRRYSIKNTLLGLAGSIKTESPIENYMFEAMQEAGISGDVKAQYTIGTKRVDFAFPKVKLVVECDGHEYHFTDSQQIEADQKRDMYLARKGWIVIHFTGIEIRRAMPVCIAKIKKYL